MRFMEDKNIDTNDAIGSLGHIPLDFREGCAKLVKEMKEKGIV